MLFTCIVKRLVCINGVDGCINLILQNNFRLISVRREITYYLFFRVDKHIWNLIESHVCVFASVCWWMRINVWTSPIFRVAIVKRWRKTNQKKNDIIWCFVSLRVKMCFLTIKMIGSSNTWFQEKLACDIIIISGPH